MANIPVRVPRRAGQLVPAGYLFLVGSAVHIFDHLRRGQGSITPELFWAGNLALIAQAVVITLILTRHPAAPRFAMIGGFALGFAFAGAHWLPEWSALSDSFVDDGASAFSYVASILEISGALAVGLTGLRIVRGQDSPA